MIRLVSYMTHVTPSSLRGHGKHCGSRAQHRAHVVKGAAVLGNGASPRHVTSHVFGQVVAAHELSVTYGTGELLLTRVRALVSRELVRPGEAFVAVLPATRKRLLAGVSSKVRLQMGALEVSLVAVIVVADVSPATVVEFHPGRVRVLPARLRVGGGGGGDATQLGLTGLVCRPRGQLSARRHSPDYVVEDDDLNDRRRGQWQDGGTSAATATSAAGIYQR